MTELLAGRDLYKSFGLTEALRGASLSVHSGEIVAVMGPSGCGKSTLLHCLAGLLAPDSGEVELDGRRIDHLPDRQRVQLRRSQFGFVFQFGQLVPELPAIENVALPLRLAGRNRHTARAAAAEWLRRLDLEGVGDRLPGQLSGGQGQRIALARALIADPRVLFADEPTGSLDSFAADQMMELVVDTVRDLRTSVILVTHEARVAAYADRTVQIRNGTDTLPVGAE